MNLAEWTIRKSLLSWVITILFLVVGWQSYQKLSRLEDPEFTIKDAVVITPYSGASAAEVEEEVTNVIEKAVQEMGQLKKVESRSSRGLSTVNVTMQDQYDKNSLPQVWDELRRKVNDAQRNLPPGAGPSLVNDDFGDVYGLFYAITGEGYSDKEIYDYAKLLQRELLKAKDVKRINLYGVQKEAIYVEMRREKMAQLGISPQDIYNTLKAKNIATNAGSMLLGTEFIPINPTGEFQSEQDFGDLLITSSNPKSNSLIYLRDVADIKRGYQDPPSTLLRYDGKPAIGLAISTVQGGNVITMSDSLEQRLKELEELRPIGMELNIISHQANSVNVSLKGFVINLAEAVAIVVGVLLLFMGLRSGLILGVVLMVTIMGTFIFMQINHVTLERISLGALIIALGMLVDCAIVVTDGMRMQMAQGKSGFDAACAIVGQTAVPMLGGTIVAIVAFAAIGTSQDSTGEYCRTLFSVILYSLLLSWLTAVTCTPLLCKTFLKVTPPSTDGTHEDPYGKGFYLSYRKFLAGCIRFRWLVVAVVVGLFISAIVGFGYVKNSFFPDSTRPQFYVDLWFPEGTDIRETEKQLQSAEVALKKHEGVTHLSSLIGGSQTRFLLTYTPEKNYAAFGQILVDVDDYARIKDLAPQIQKEFETSFPDAITNVRLFVLGPSSGGKIQLRLYGADSEELRSMASKAENILLNEPNARAVRNEWREKIKVVRPQIAETQARKIGIDRPEIAHTMESAFQGTKVGIYREQDELLPILARAPQAERLDLNSLGGIQIWSPAARTMIPIGQVVSGFDTEFEDPYIWRLDRRKMIRLHADPREGLPSELFAKVKANIEQALNVDTAAIVGHEVDTADFNNKTLKVQDNDLWPIKGKPGYYMAWGGEAEDSSRANASLAGAIPIFFGIMVFIVLALFNSIKKTLVIWLAVPLALIGVTVGLLSFSQPFGFMALLGLMSLSGMTIKAAIVLVDEIDVQMAEGKTPYQAVLTSGVSRLIPVCMSSGTTMLGMIPLFSDAFFVAMAVTIVFGLGFATVLVLIVVPVFYSLFFNIKADDNSEKPLNLAKG
jgi:multidrug efflux pump subunit AcrB